MTTTPAQTPALETTPAQTLAVETTFFDKTSTNPVTGDTQTNNFNNHLYQRQVLNSSCGDNSQYCVP